jgi:hypothetical protein
VGASATRGSVGFGARARAGGIPCGGGRRLRPSGSAEESNEERTAHFGGPPLHPLAAHRDQSEGVGPLIHRNLVDASRARAQVPCMGLPVRCTAAAAASRAHLHETVLWRACHFPGERRAHPVRSRRARRRRHQFGRRRSGRAALTVTRARGHGRRQCARLLLFDRVSSVCLAPRALRRECAQLPTYSI